MKNIYILPTNKLIQNIYITSDEEIKEGDWVFNFEYNYIVQYNSEKHDNKFWYKKIILTTDQDLIKDGVQAIDDEFLEWFVKNPSCEEVDIKRNYLGSKCLKCGFIENHDEVDTKDCPKCHNTTYEHLYNNKIVIPQEEPKKETTQAIDKLFDEAKSEFGNTLKMLSDSFIDKTLEEAAERYVKSDLKKTPLYWLFHDTFKAGAKWQQEQDKKMYNEEEVRETVNWKAVYEESLSMQRTSNAGYESKINELKEKIKTMYSEKEVLELLRKAHFVEQNIEEWFEQFKKKINARKFEKRKNNPRILPNCCYGHCLLGF